MDDPFLGVKESFPGVGEPLPSGPARPCYAAPWGNIFDGKVFEIRTTRQSVISEFRGLLRTACGTGWQRSRDTALAGRSGSRRRVTAALRSRSRGDYDSTMTRVEALELLKSGPEGVKKWNQWREEYREERPNEEIPEFDGADLRNARLERANLILQR